MSISSDILHELDELRTAGPRDLVAPADGVLIHMSEVPDHAFSSGQAGVGFAVYPQISAHAADHDHIQVVAPIAGTISFIAENGHAIGIRGAYGIELILHIGLDTNQLSALSFPVSVRLHDTISVGAPICRLALSYLKHMEKAPLIVVAITNGLTEEPRIAKYHGHVRHGEVLVTHL